MKSLIVIGISSCLLVLILAIGIEAAGYKWYLPWKKDKEYALVQHSREFVDSRQAKINGLVSEYLNLETDIAYYSGTPESEALVAGFNAQQANKIVQMCEAASDINDDQVPAAAKPLMRTKGCWNGF